MHRFKITEAYYPNIFEGFMFSGEVKPVYGVSIKAEELPDSLRPFARQPKEHRGVNIITVSAAKVPPRVVMAEGRQGAAEWSKILQMARAGNLPVDYLFRGIPMELAVEVVEFDSRDQPGSTAFLRAVRVRYTDLLCRYDELCAEFFP